MICLHRFLLISLWSCHLAFKSPHIYTIDHIITRSSLSIQKSYQTTTLQMAKNPYKRDQSTIDKVQKYIQMKELRKLREDGSNYEEVKEFLINGTKSNNNNNNNIGDNNGNNKKGYQKFMGKGSLEQRLRAVVAYKRSGYGSNEGGSSTTDISGSLSASEERELDEMMESDDQDEDYDEDLDEEEAEYESLVLKAIELNKLNELKRNFEIDKSARREEMAESLEATNDKTSAIPVVSSVNATKSSGYTAEEDLYVPARSSWGVFERPRDISKVTLP